MTPGQHDPTHRYTGPSTRWGLRRDSIGRITGKRAGGVLFRPASHTTDYLVGEGQLQKIESKGAKP